MEVHHHLLLILIAHNLVGTNGWTHGYVRKITWSIIKKMRGTYFLKYDSMKLHLYRLYDKCKLRKCKPYIIQNVIIQWHTIVCESVLSEPLIRRAQEASKINRGKGQTTVVLIEQWH